MILTENSLGNTGKKKLIMITSVKFINKVWPILTNAHANINAYGSDYYQKLKKQINLPNELKF